MAAGHDVAQARELEQAAQLAAGLAHADGAAGATGGELQARELLDDGEVGPAASGEAPGR